VDVFNPPPLGSSPPQHSTDAVLTMDPAPAQLLSVGPFRHANVMASGGVSPSEAHEWLAAGAMAVGIGAQVPPSLPSHSPCYPCCPPASAAAYLIPQHDHDLPPPPFPSWLAATSA
jgi:hypothetical protein